MLGATPLTSVLGSGVDNTDHAAVRSFINAACGQGLALLLIHPNSKAPADMRTSRTKSSQDRAAQNAAKEAGRPDWQKVRSPSGLALATTDAKIVNRYLDEYIRIHGDDVPVNLAVEVGKSRLVVVDCDTKAQYEKFIAVAQAPEGTSPTVTSPGQIGPNGDWAHKDGGHFYFTVPDGVELPKNLGAMTWGGEDGFAVLWDRRYVLIPPSSRPEGKYELTGRDYPLPGWLRDEILKVGEVRELRAAKMSTADDESDLTNSIDAWSETISWADILEPLGWSPSPRADACGCAVWTAPGNHASPKSATAHDSGCNLGIYTQTNAPLHIWTDHPGEPFEAYIDRTHSQTLSKLQAVAYAEFDGNVGAAMDSLDLIPPPDTIASELGVDTRDMVNDVAGEDVAAEIVVPEPQPEPQPEPELEPQSEPEPEPQPSEPADDTFADGDDRDPDVWESNVNGVPTIAPFSHWLSLPPPEFVVDGLVEHGALVSVIGPPGVGKSTVALDMACHIATGMRWQGRDTLKTRVLYMPGEGLSGVVQRLRAWSALHKIDIATDLMLANNIIQLGASREAWGELAGYIIRNEIGLVIFDTFARMAVGLEENSATEVGKAVVRFDQIRRLTNAGVMIVHHTVKGNDQMSRGSSALNGALESEIAVLAGWSAENIGAGDPPEGKELTVITTKQKNAEQLQDGIPLLMRNYSKMDAAAGIDAPVITGPGGSVDPLEGDVVLARPIPEPIIETAIRIREFVDRFTEQGCTRSDIVTGVEPDPYTKTLKESAKRWRIKVNEAVDRGLWAGLLMTLEGASSRYVSGTQTAEGARAMVTAAVITD